jgi:ABC-type glycerol-3-phosphate transport system substrate-binding protein
MKRSKTAVLLIAILFILAACSQAVAEVVPEYDPSTDPDEIDLLGYEYKIAAETHGGGEYQLSPDPGSSDRGDKLLQRYKDTEKKFNVTLNIQDGSNLGTFITEYAAGIKYADLMISKIADVFNGKYVQNGYFMAFSDMDIDLFSGLYGTPGTLEAGSFGNKYYSIVAYYWGVPTPYTMPAMWFNPRVISDYQQTSPHELNEQGEWTWATLEKMCEAIHDTSNPDKEQQTYALAYTSEPYLEFAALFSNGARAVTKNADGKLEYTLNSSAAIEAMDFVQSLAARDLICDGGDRQNITPFVENKRAFFLEFTHLGLSSEGSNNLSYQMQDAYEWIYFPTGPSGDPTSNQRSAYSYHSRIFYAPINSDAEVHSLLLPYLLQPLPGETEDTWQDVLKRNNFYSEESFEYFQMIRDDAFFDYTPFIPFSDMQSMLLRITRGNRSASESFSSVAEQYQSSLDKLYNDYLE